MKINNKEDEKHKMMPIPLTSGTSTSLSSQIDSIPCETECTPDSIFFLTHEIQCQTPRGRRMLKGGFRQERWYPLLHPFPSQHLKMNKSHERIIFHKINETQGKKHVCCITICACAQPCDNKYLSIK